eukprot:Rmarinus@m.29095
MSSLFSSGGAGFRSTLQKFFRKELFLFASSLNFVAALSWLNFVHVQTPSLSLTACWVYATATLAGAIFFAQLLAKHFRFKFDAQRCEDPDDAEFGNNGVSPEFSVPEEVGGIDKIVRVFAEQAMLVSSVALHEAVSDTMQAFEAGGVIHILYICLTIVLAGICVTLLTSEEGAAYLLAHAPRSFARRDRETLLAIGHLTSGGWAMLIALAWTDFIWDIFLGEYEDLQFGQISIAGIWIYTLILVVLCLFAIVYLEKFREEMAASSIAEAVARYPLAVGLTPAQRNSAVRGYAAGRVRRESTWILLKAISLVCLLSVRDAFELTMKLRGSKPGGIQGAVTSAILLTVGLSVVTTILERHFAKIAHALIEAERVAVTAASESLSASSSDDDDGLRRRVGPRGSKGSGVEEVRQRARRWKLYNRLADLSVSGLGLLVGKSWNTVFIRVLSMMTEGLAVQIWAMFLYAVCTTGLAVYFATLVPVLVPTMSGTKLE